MWMIQETKRECGRNVPIALEEGMRHVESVGQRSSGSGIRQKKDSVNYHRVQRLLEEGNTSFSGMSGSLFLSVSELFLKCLNKLSCNLIGGMTFNRGPMNHPYKFSITHESKRWR